MAIATGTALLAGGIAAGAGAIGSAAIGSSAAGGASRLQYEAMLRSLKAQEEMANRGFDVFARESERARAFLREQTDAAKAELAPLRDIGLASLKAAQGMTDPNSPEAAAERQAFGKTLANNLSARGLTASGTEIAGLRDFEVAMGRERRNMALGLVGLGANTLTSLSGLESGLGQGLAGISSNLGQTGASLFGNLGTNLGSTISQGGAGLANLQLQKGQAWAGGLAGLGNAFQGTLQGFGSLNAANQQQAFQQQLLALLSGNTAGGGVGGSGGFMNFAG